MRSLTTDSLRNFKFRITIASPNANVPSTLNSLGFMTCSGLGVQNEVIPYREGGDNTTTRKMPGQTDFGPLTLGRGMMAAPTGPNYTAIANAGTNETYAWLLTVFSAIEGSGTAAPGDNFRSDFTIDLLEHPVTQGNYAAGINTSAAIKARFYVMNAWPMGLSYSDLDAGGNAVMIETLQLAHEGFAVIYGNQTPGQYVSASATP